MLGPCCLEVGFTSDQKFFETPKAPHHSFVCIEDQFHTQIMLPPLEPHDPIAHPLEESYIARTCARLKLALFILFACISRSRVCVCLIDTRSVAQHRDKSINCMSCTCTHLCSMDTFKLEMCLYSLLYLSCFLVHTVVLFENHAFTNMG